ncbi:GNAT family N-acetyltransferase [Dyadobacter sandarakinus]|uniref:GNAT family N-acetyltransferase n=1 Tax=Dyadobacter sandarakinus TaxID=2747268 RepID=A0ABX7I3B7_9BACT|nr:GNAT family N-acetyltransferase [Dyadobacter sandarakinus]QRR00012.1 GNAT family N-acetyltransferase [Dyadobacter sandarakinus]
MPSFTIKAATPGDIPVIISIQEKTWEPTYRDILSQEQIAYMFGKIYAPAALLTQFEEGQRFVILCNNSVPAGFAAFSEETPGCFKLHKIYVLPAEQGSGAGRFLLENVEQLVRQSGARILSLNVNRYNKALTFYERQGFVVVAEKDIPIGPYWMNDYILEKQLI